MACPISQDQPYISFVSPDFSETGASPVACHGSYKVLGSSAGKTKWGVETGVFEPSFRWSCAALCQGEKLRLLTPVVLLTRDFLHLSTPRQSDFPPVIREEFCLDYLTSQLLPARLLLHLHTGEPYIRREDSRQANPLWRDPCHVVLQSQWLSQSFLGAWFQRFTDFHQVE